MSMRRRKKQSDDDDNGFALWGGYMAAKKSKLAEQFSHFAGDAESTRVSNIFEGVSIFVNGYTNPSADELKKLMAQHGGVYQHYHSPSSTTFVIASNLPDTKIKQLGSDEKIVRPEWITDSVKCGKLLDYRDYVLYSKLGRNQKRLNFRKLNKAETPAGDVTDSNDANLNELISGLTEALNEKTEENDKFYVEDVSMRVIDIEADTKVAENADNLNQLISVPTEEAVYVNSDKENVKDSNTDVSFIVPATQTHEKPHANVRTAVDPKFLSEFYSNSRLHHISTLGATFKQHICNLREDSPKVFTARETFVQYLATIKKSSNSKWIPPINKPIIMHIDMDCFFVSVGLRCRPELRGLPVGVTHARASQEPPRNSAANRQAELEYYQRKTNKTTKNASDVADPKAMATRLLGIESLSMSEIASCSYEARKAGIKNGMFLGAALKLCPNLQTIPYDFEGYKEVAYTLYNTIAEYTLDIEAVSCDEMFVDITELLKSTGASIDQWASYIRDVIQKKTGCPCSTGFGINKLQARLATRSAKPCGQFYLPEENVEDYMLSIDVNDLPGVGRSLSHKLESLNVKTCSDMQALSLQQLQTELGARTGETLYNYCRGIDNRPLVFEQERKSVSAEVNYGIRFKNDDEAETFLRQLCGEVHSRLLETKMKGRCITLKLMIRSEDAPVESSKFMGHGICDNVAKSVTLNNPISDLNTITKEILSLSRKLAIPPSDLRGIGVQISRLEKPPKVSKALSDFLKKGDEKHPEFSETKNSDEVIKNEKISEKENIVTNESSSKGNSRQSSSKNGKAKNKGKADTKSRPKAKVLKDENCSLDKFFMVEAKRKDDVTQILKNSNIDIEVFCSLPDYVQREVLQQCQSNNKAPEPVPSVSAETVADADIDIDPVQSLCSMSVPDVRDLLRLWIDTETTPKEYDVEVVGEFFKILALERKIENLEALVNFVYRQALFKKQCVWHKAYFSTLTIMQDGMLERYGGILKVQKDFDCASCSELFS